MKTTCIRTAMIGGGLSYRVYVRVSDTPEYIRNSAPGGRYHTTIIDNGVEYYDYTTATQSEAHEQMPQGIERWHSWLAHEKKAQKQMLEISRKVYPELNNIDTWPTLWISGVKKPSAQHEIDV